MDEEYPYTILANHKEHHEDINQRYKASVNAALNNILTSQDLMAGAIMPVSASNPMKADYIQKQSSEILQYLAKNFAHAPTAMYGNHDASIYGKALFLDRYEAVQHPEKVLEHMGNGRATADQIMHLRQFFPQVYEDYKNQSITNLVGSDEDFSQEHRAIMYGNTGAETSPMVSKANVTKRIQAQMQPPQAQNDPSNGKIKVSKMGQPKMTLQEETFAPFTSSQGKAP